MTAEQAGISKAALRRAQLLFAQECKFLRPVGKFADLPPTTLPEIAFAGRSNVGKSSLVNALVNRKTLARVSNTPGRTREIILFDLAGRLTIADLPGYGFARVPKAMAAEWRRLIEAYLRGRPQLRRVCLLIDARHGAQENDRTMMDILDEAAASFVLVLTKTDKLKAAERVKAVNDAEAQARAHTAAHPEIFATSAETGAGLAELRAHLAALAETGYKAAAHGRRG
ncbi:MAG: YihA family ribosome biogenesis GTP-binding protein [Alphaproteobacteria bacterium]|nr:YihA family ribosome biogenesis GTP-binding protein [Alphaproteobacteria bacterium]